VSPAHAKTTSLVIDDPIAPARVSGGSSSPSGSARQVWTRRKVSPTWKGPAPACLKGGGELGESSIHIYGSFEAWFLRIGCSEWKCALPNKPGAGHASARSASGTVGMAGVLVSLSLLPGETRALPSLSDPGGLCPAGRSRSRNGTSQLPTDVARQDLRGPTCTRLARRAIFVVWVPRAGTPLPHEQGSKHASPGLGPGMAGMARALVSLSLLPGRRGPGPRCRIGRASSYPTFRMRTGVGDSA
jgi:hypothetical protein